MRRRLLWVWALLALAWIGGIAYGCLSTWPSIPLDVSPNDPGTRAALAHAIAMHAARCGVIGLAPPLGLLLLGWLIARLMPTRA